LAKKDWSSHKRRIQLKRKIMVSHGLADIPLTEINKGKAVKDLMVAEVVIMRIFSNGSYL